MSKFILADETTIVDVENVVRWEYHPAHDDAGAYLTAFSGGATKLSLCRERAETVWGWLLFHVEP